MKIPVRQRKRNRLKNFDYSSNGYYFVTICTKHREEYFGGIINNRVVLNEYGNIVNKYWHEIPKHFNNVLLDIYQIMPNHIHGILIIKHNNNSIVGNRHACSLQKKSIRRQNELLPNVINLFKSSSSKFIHQTGFNSFQWQKSFYDHIIHHERSLNNIREYIKNNPYKWDDDEENPKNIE